MEGSEEVCPLIPFLQALIGDTCTDDEIHPTVRLPRFLKTLALHDRYHLDVPSPYQSIAKTVQQCAALNTIEVSL